MASAIGEMDKLYCLFKEIDREDSGVISKPELRLTLESPSTASLMTDAQIALLAKELEADLEGSIDFSSFVTIFMGVWDEKLNIVKQNFEEYRHEFYDDVPGEMPVEELNTVHTEHIVNTLKSLSSDAGLSIDGILNFITMSDKDGNGFLTFAEFNFLVNTPLLRSYAAEIKPVYKKKRPRMQNLALAGTLADRARLPMNEKAKKWQEDKLPENCRAVWVTRVVMQRTIETPTTVVIKNGVTDMSCLDVFNQFWKMTIPKRVFVVIGLDADHGDEERMARKFSANLAATRIQLNGASAENGMDQASDESDMSPAAYRMLKMVLSRSILKLTDAMTITDGRPDTQINQCIGGLMRQPGFEGRTDLNAIGVRGMPTTQCERLYNNTGEMTSRIHHNGEDDFNRYLSKNLIMEQSEFDDQVSVMRKFERVIRKTSMDSAVIVVESKYSIGHKSDLRVLLHLIRRGHRVIVLTSMPMKKWNDPSVSKESIGHAFHLHAEYKSKKLMTQATRKKSVLMGGLGIAGEAMRATGVSAGMDAVKGVGDKLTAGTLDRMTDEMSAGLDMMKSGIGLSNKNVAKETSQHPWESYRLEYHRLAEIVESGQVRMLHLDADQEGAVVSRPTSARSTTSTTTDHSNKADESKDFPLRSPPPGAGPTKGGGAAATNSELEGEFVMEQFQAYLKWAERSLQPNPPVHDNVYEVQDSRVSCGKLLHLDGQQSFYARLSGVNDITQLSRSDFEDLVHHRWQLPHPKIICGVLGNIVPSADGREGLDALSFDSRALLRAMSFHGLTKICADSDGMLLTTGIRHNNIQALIGQAYEACPRFPLCIGATSIDHLKAVTEESQELKDMVWRYARNSVEKDKIKRSDLEGLTHEELESVLRKIILEDRDLGLGSLTIQDKALLKTNYSLAEKDVPGQLHLNPNLSALIALDESKEPEEEKKWATLRSNSSLLRSLSMWYKDSLPTYIYLVGGSNVETIDDVEFCASNDIPVFIVVGTGGIADELYRYISIREEHDTQKLDNFEIEVPGMKIDNMEAAISKFKRIAHHVGDMASPIFPLKILKSNEWIPKSPSISGQYIQRLFKMQITLDLSKNGLIDSNCKRISRSLAVDSIPMHARNFFNRIKHGRIGFVESGNIVPFVSVGREAYEHDVLGILKLAWNLDDPELIVSFEGSKQFPTRKWDKNVDFIPNIKKLEKALRVCLMPMCAKQRTWMITGGCPSGHIDVVGKAFQRSEIEVKDKVTCLGIMPRGRVVGNYLIQGQGNDMSSGLMYHHIKKKVQAIFHDLGPEFAFWAECEVDLMPTFLMLLAMCGLLEGFGKGNGKDGVVKAVASPGEPGFAEAHYEGKKILQVNRMGRRLPIVIAAPNEEVQELWYQQLLKLRAKPELRKGGKEFHEDKEALIRHLSLMMIHLQDESSTDKRQDDYETRLSKLSVADAIAGIKNCTYRLINMLGEQKLCPNHTHFVLADTAIEWNEELPLRQFLESNLAPCRKIKFCIGGSDAVWKSVKSSIRLERNVPIILVKGLGGASEDIAKAYESDTDFSKVFGDAFSTKSMQRGSQWGKLTGGASRTGSRMAKSLKQKSEKKKAAHKDGQSHKEIGKADMPKLDTAQEVVVYEMKNDPGLQIVILDVMNDSLKEMRDKLTAVHRNVFKNHTRLSRVRLYNDKPEDRWEPLKFKEKLDGWLAHQRPDASTVPFTGPSLYTKGESEVVLPLNISKIQVLNLSHNNLTDESMKVFASHLANNMSLVDVDLSYNKGLTERTAMELAQALVHNRSVLRLDLKGTSISPNSSDTPGKQGIEVLDCIAFSRGMTCDYGHGVGCGVIAQQVAQMYYARWMEWLEEEIPSQVFDTQMNGMRELQDEEIRNIMAWPMHSAVGYPAVLTKIMDDYTKNLLPSSADLTGDGNNESGEDVYKFIENTGDFEYNTLIHRGIKKGHLEGVAIALEALDLTKYFFQLEDLDGCTVYQQALIHKKESKLIIEGGKNSPEAAEKENKKTARSLYKYMDQVGSSFVSMVSKAADVASWGSQAAEASAAATAVLFHDTDEENMNLLRDQAELCDEMVNLLASHKHVQTLRSKYALKTFVNELSTYFIFLLVGTTVALLSSGGFIGGKLYGEKSTDMFMNREAVWDTLNAGDLNYDPNNAFTESENAWKYVRDISPSGEGWVMGGLLDSTWGTGGEADRSILDSENVMISSMRLRQLRVKGWPCPSGGEEPYGHMDYGPTECYPNWGEATEDKAPITHTPSGEVWSLAEYGVFPPYDGTVWQSAKQNGHGSYVYNADQTTGYNYPGSGYVVDIPGGNRTRAAGILRKVFSGGTGGWNTRATRALFIEMTYYNVNSKNMLSCSLLLELPADGSTQTYRRMIGMSAERDASTSPKFLLECVFNGMSILYLLVEFGEIYERYADRPHADLRTRVLLFWEYLFSEWNAVDWSNILIVIVWIYYRIMIWGHIDELHEFLEQPPFDPVTGTGVSHIATMQMAHSSQIETNLLGLIMVLYWLKVLKYLTYAPSFGPVVQGLVATMFDQDVLIFVVVLLVIVFAFTIGFVVAFSQFSQPYHTIQLGIIQLAFLTLGDLNDDLYEYGRHWGQVFSFMVLMVPSLIMLNILIAVISEAYATCKEKADSNWEAAYTERMMSGARRRNRRRNRSKNVMSLLSVFGFHVDNDHADENTEGGSRIDITSAAVIAYQKYRETQDHNPKKELDGIKTSVIENFNNLKMEHLKLKDQIAHMRK